MKTLTVIILAQVFVGVLMASLNFSTLSVYIEAFSMAKGAGARIFSVIDRVSPINNFSKDGKRPEQMNGNISFRDVHFEYPTRPDVKVSESHTLCLTYFFVGSHLFMYSIFTNTVNNLDCLTLNY